MAMHNLMVRVHKIRVVSKHRAKLQTQIQKEVKSDDLFNCMNISEMYTYDRHRCA
jgi:hypothetical protein